MTTASRTSAAMRRRARRAGRAARLALAILALAGGVVAGVMLFVMDRPMVAPDWLQARIEARAGALWPEGEVGLGTITFELRRSLDVSVGVQNLALRSEDGTPLLELARLDATLARRGLVRTALEPKEISASGLFLTLERSAEGEFNLAFGASVAQSAPDFRSFMAALDQALEAPQFEPLRRVTLDAVTLEYRDLLSRQTWVIDGGRFQGTRAAGEVSLRGDLALLTGGADVATLSVTASSPIGSRAMTLGVVLDNMPAEDIATQSPALAWLGVLQAPISGALRGALTEEGLLAPLSATLQIGRGALQPSAETRPIPFEAARTYFTFDPVEARFDFTEISLTSDWLSGTGTATALLDLHQADGLSGFTGQVHIEQLRADPAGRFEEGPRVFRDLRADLHLDLDPFHLRVGQMTAHAGTLALRGEADIRVAAAGWDVSALLQAPRAVPAQVLELWPPDLVPNTRKWIASNVRSALFRDVQAYLRVREEGPSDVYLGSTITSAEVRALRNLPLLDISEGRLTLEDRAFTVFADEASIDPGQGGRIDLSGTRFHIPDTRARPGEAEVHVATRGSIEATLALLDNPPLRVLQKINRTADLAEGTARLNADLSFPLRPGVTAKEVAFRGTGTLRNLRSDALVTGRDLRAEVLEVEVDAEAVRISGQGQLSDVPFDAEWRMPISGPPETRVASLRADLALSEATLAAFGVALPPDTLSGESRAALDMAFPPGERPEFVLGSTLEGLGIRIAPLQWALDAAAAGRFELAGALGPQPRIDRITLEAPGLDVTGRLDLAGPGVLQQAVFDRLRVGSWLDAAVTLKPRGDGLAPALQVRSGQLDLRAAPFGRNGAPGRGAATGAGDTPLDVADMTLRINDTLRLDGLTGSFRAGPDLIGRFAARVNGGTRIEGEVLRRDGGTGLDIDAEDAGAVLRDAGLFDDMVGGSFALKLRPTGAPGRFDGTLSIDRVRIRNAPTVAALLNAISIVGLLDEMTGQGIYFEEIDAAFRLGRGSVTITQSSAVGPSMGLSLDGFYDQTNRRIDVQGVVSPFYAVNIVGRVFARRGEGLIGIAFTMQGDADAPQVAVNPLSALTPGMFREIFRRPPPSLDE